MQIKKILSAWMIALINVVAICNVKNFPLMAEYGLSLVFFLIMIAIFFFIPVSLVSAELATGWPEKGVYTWVKEGLNPCFGFLAIWLQWIENVIWYPTILSFIATTIAYIFMPELAANKTYMLAVIIATFWLASFINFFGIHVSGWISSVGALLGAILPVCLISFLGLVWISHGFPSQIYFSIRALLPDLSSFNELVLLSGVTLSFAGLEMSAIHARDVANPKKDYPKAIFLSAFIILCLTILGALTIAIIIPKHQLEFASGGIDAFKVLFSAFGISWAVPLIAVVMTLGALSMLSTWIVGCSRGLLATAQDGILPSVFQKTNRYGMPIPIFILQAVIVSIFSLVFLYMPSISASYWILSVMSSELYMVMYILLFIAAIRLRYTHPQVERTYRVPGGKIGIWCISCLGILGASFAMIVSYFPPSQLPVGNLAVYESIFIGGTSLFIIIPMIIYWMRKCCKKLTIQMEI